MTICHEIRRLILNYMDSHGHYTVHAMEAAVLYDCSIRTIWTLISRRKESGLYGAWLWPIIQVC
jgi:hypothetical protein